ncbi:MAG: hypothetical protein K1W04_07585 [Oscillospiraceae bacterium]
MKQGGTRWERRPAQTVGNTTFLSFPVSLRFWLWVNGIQEVSGSIPLISTTNEADGLHRLLHCLFSGQGYRRNVALPLVSYALLGQVAEKTLGTPVKV